MNFRLRKRARAEQQTQAISDQPLCAVFEDAKQCVAWLNTELKTKNPGLAAAILTNDEEKEIVCPIGIYDRQSLNGANHVRCENHVDLAYVDKKLKDELCAAFATAAFRVEELGIFEDCSAEPSVHNCDTSRKIIVKNNGNPNVNQIIINGLTTQVLRENGEVIRETLKNPQQKPAQHPKPVAA